MVDSIRNGDLKINNGDLNIPADLAPAHDCPKIVVSLWRQRDFMWQTTIKKKHPLYCGVQPLQGFVLQNPTNEQSGLFSSPHERSYSFASCGQQVEASVCPHPVALVDSAPF